MPANHKPRPSFSASRRLWIGLDGLLRTVLVLAVVGMLNFLGAKFYHRFYLSAATRAVLSSRSLAVVHALTNRVDVTLYYDTHNQANFYPDIAELLNAYHDANPNIQVRTVDYERNPAEAAKVKEEFNLPTTLADPNAPPAKDLVIFSSGARHAIVPGAVIIGTKTVMMSTNDPDFDPNEKRPQYLRLPVNFNGEVLFTSQILALTHTQPLHAYFLQRHGEASLADTSDTGFQKFGLTLMQNDMAVNNLDLFGAAEVPADCALLVIAAPVKEFDAAELQKIDNYLSQGGKLLALFNYFSLRQPTGLESLLQRWGVTVAADYVKDPQSSRNDQFVVVTSFNPKTFVNPLMRRHAQRRRGRFAVLGQSIDQRGGEPGFSDLCD